jgi:hypothetical protein
MRCFLVAIFSSARLRIASNWPVDNSGLRLSLDFARDYSPQLTAFTPPLMWHGDCF